jgi:hypothetical protein
MTNREWLATLSDEDFVNWIYAEKSIFHDPKTFKVVEQAVYYPTKTEITMGWTSYSDRMLQWLGEERREIIWKMF